MCAAVNCNNIYVHLQGDMFVGIPFLFGVVPVILALLVAFCIKSEETLMKKSEPSLLDSQHST